MQESEIRNGVVAVAQRARVAARAMRHVTTAQKDALLNAIAAILRENTPAIIAANEIDIAAGRERGLDAGLIDRLMLDPQRIDGIATATEKVASLPDPIGEVVRGRRLPNGLTLRQVRVPMGVIGMIYEARPNVTVDAAALTLKAGSAVILRGGSAAFESNRVIVELMRKAAEQVGLPADAIQSIDEFGRAGGVELMKLRGLVDVVIPRGGAGLIQTVVRESVVPVIETGTGNCHVYVDRAADLEKALAIAVNSKVSRPSVCNAAESILVHADVAERFVPRLLRELASKDVRLHVDESVRGLAGDIQVELATEEDWATEYLALEVAIRVVPSLEAAIEHIEKYSTGHTEAIVSQDLEAIETFKAGIDSAVIMVNASTRFTDGGEFGLGAEIGISTQKLHARGPMGLAEITTTTWIAEGQGHVR